MTKPDSLPPPAHPRRDAPDRVWAAYARYSDRRQDRSVEQQVAEFRTYAVQNQIVLPEAYIYSDEAKSGKSDVSREGLFRLMATLERRPRPVAGVLLWASSRLARNMDDADWYKASIRRGGYELVYVGEPMLQSIGGLEGRLMEDVTEYVDAKYRENLARDVVRGMYDELGQGHAISRAPRGYQVALVDGVKRFVIDAALAPLVRQAWEMRAAGRCLREIHEATRLYKTGTGYTNLFRNRTYLGIVSWRGHERADFCEPLATPEQWAAVRELSANLPHPRRARSSYLLSGRAFCDCGQPLFGQGSMAAGHRLYRYYRCRDELAMSIHNSIGAALLESHVIERAQGTFTPAKLGPAVRSWQKRREGHAGRASREIEQLKVRLVTVSRAIDNLLAAVEKGGQAAPQSLVDQLAARELEHKSISEQLLVLPPPAPVVEFDLDAYCAGIQAKLASGDPGQVRQVLRVILEKVVVPRPEKRKDEDDVVIEFRRLPD